MALNDFQKKKLMWVFTTFYDMNHDGVIDWADFTQDIDKLSALLKWAPDSAPKKAAEASLKAIWDALRSQADKDHDDKISNEEWLAMWTSVIGSGGPMPAWLTQYLEFMFVVNDGNGDDVIDIDEYTQVFRMYGVSDEECKKSFAEITSNDTIKITKEEYQRLGAEYFTAPAAGARGNSLFGVIH